MKVIFYFFIIFFLFTSTLLPHSDHYKNFNQIEFEIYRNSKLVGYNKYNFYNKGKILEIKNIIAFNVKLLGKDIIKLYGKSSEIHTDGKLISFTSETTQNNKIKYVKISVDENSDKLKINSSSNNGIVDPEIIVGNWWNHQILLSDKFISPVTGSIRNQDVDFIKKSKISLNGKDYMTEVFKITTYKSNKKNLVFLVWYEKRKNIIFKVKYNKYGEWEYRLKKFN